MGRTPQFDLELDHRFSWGEIQLLLTLREGRVARADVYSDALDAELPALLQGLLEGAPLSADALADALACSENPQVQDIAAWLRTESV